jgi:hypothetical protein
MRSSLRCRSGCSGASAASRISSASTMAEMHAAGVAAVGDRVRLFGGIGSFGSAASKKDWEKTSPAGSMAIGCSLTTVREVLSHKETLAAILEVATQRAGESSHGAHGTAESPPAAHALALVKHNGKLYLFDPERREEAPSRGKFTPRLLREPILEKFGAVFFKSGNGNPDEARCREGVISFLHALSHNIDGVLGDFAEMKK